MPRPLEFHTPNRRSVRLPLEGGAPRSEFKIYMTAGGSHTSTTLAQRQLRLMRSKRSTITMGWYKIATFDLIRHGLWPVTPSPPGEGFFLSRQPLRRFLPLKYRYQAHRGMPPPLQRPAGGCFYPFTLPAVTPLMMLLDRMIYTTSTGRMASRMNIYTLPRSNLE